MPLTYDRAGWQDAYMAQGTRGSTLWAEEGQPKAGRGTVCSQLTPSPLVAACNGQSPLGEAADTTKKTLLLEVDRK